MKLNEIINQHAEIEALLKSYGIENYTIHPDGTVDVAGNVDLCDHNFDQLPVKFGIVTGFFDCTDCHNLLSLVGSPTAVGGYVSINSCSKLTSLVAGPQYIGSFFSCNGCNNLETLAGAPLSVHNFFEAIDCPKIKSLEGFNTKMNKGTIYFSWENIERGGISLLLCDAGDSSIEYGSGLHAFEIIEKYLQRPDDIFECQAELIEAGYAEYAVL